MTRGEYKGALLPLLCMVLCIALWSGAAQQLSDLEAHGQSIGLRYAQGGVTQEALNTLALKEDDPLRANWLAWAEKSGSAQDPVSQRSSAATALLLCGDPQLLYDHSEYRAGSAPLMGDVRSCAVSAALAEALWRNYDVIGAEVEWGETTYVVTGVLREQDEALILLQNPKGEKEQLFTALEISQVPGETGSIGTPDAQARQFANASGLSTGDVVIGYANQALTLRQVAALPLLFILALAAWRMGTAWRKRNPSPLSRIVRAATVVGVLAIGIWGLNGWVFWPEQWRPTRWSAFEFWGQQWQQTMTQLDAYFALPGYLPDVMRQKTMMLAFACILGATFLVFPVHSRKEGTPGEKLAFALFALLAAFGCSVALQASFERPVWIAWPLYWCALALFAFVPAQLKPSRLGKKNRP